MNHKPTVLVVDDSEDLRDMLVDGLSDLFKVVTACDGINGLMQAMEIQPDCIIIDVKMPGLDGFQLVRALRGDPATAQIPLVILTALHQEEARFIGLASGVDQYLTKPVVPSELIPVINRAIQLGQAERIRLQRLLAESE